MTQNSRQRPLHRAPVSGGHMRGSKPEWQEFRVVGVTGISGSGTSTVAKILEEQGGFIINADKLAHAAQRKGGSAFTIIIKTFGEGILDENGEINRRSLGALVFGSENKEKLQILEQIIHPIVIAEIHTQIKDAANSGKYNFAVIDAPLLIESGLNNLCNTCWLITAPHNLRLQRITARDGIDQETAERRLNSRPGDETLRPHADIVIENDGELETLCNRVLTALLEIGGREPC